MSKNPELALCPFCGKPGEYIKTRYEGTGASGMEPDRIYAGCKSCKISFYGGDEQEWVNGKGYIENSLNAHKEASNLWNRRMRV